MRDLSFSRITKPTAYPALQVGSLGYIAVFVWAFGMVLLVRPTRLLLSAGICLAVEGIIYPREFRRLLRPRWLLMIVLLSVPPVLWMEPDSYLWRIPISLEGLQLGLHMALRAIVILVAVNGLTASVDISTLAGLFERLGLRGLGFSMGVALNLLPSLRQSATNAWHSLKMRGGLRRQWWRGLQLLAITIITNALRRSEEIALAAEARAFSPEHSRALPVKTGSLDWPIVFVGLLSWLIFCFLS